MTETGNYIIFVYGTLRKGEMYSSSLDRSEYIGESELEGFILRDLGEYPMAFLRDCPDLKIKIEIYKINRLTLHQLDIIEEYREGDENSLYQRDIVKCKSGLSGLIYYGNDESKYLSCKIIQSGDWKIKD